MGNDGRVGMPGCSHPTCCPSRGHSHRGNRVRPRLLHPTPSARPAMHSAVGCLSFHPWWSPVPTPYGAIPGKSGSEDQDTHTAGIFAFPSLVSLAGKRRKVWAETGCPGPPKNLGMGWASELWRLGQVHVQSPEMETPNLSHLI